MDGPIAAVQEALRREQFYFNEPTGVLDESTQAALRRFQTRRGLPVTGEIDTATLQALQRQAETSQPAITSAPQESQLPPPPKEIVEGDREFLKKVESGDERIPAKAESIVEPAVLPPPAPAPAPAVTVAPPTSSAPAPSRPEKAVAVKRKPVPAKSRPVQPSRQAKGGMIERAFAAETDDTPPQRNAGLESVEEAPPRRPEARFGASTMRTGERESDLDVTAPSGVKVIRSSKAVPGPDGRTYIYEKTTTTYSGTPIPAGRTAAPANSRAKGGTFFERLFREED